MSEPVYVVATIKVKPGKETETENIFKTLVEATHQEAGCVIYTLHKRLDQPGTYYFIEQWKSQADLDKHLGSAHLQAAFARREELLNLADIGVITPLLGGDPKKGSLFRSQINDRL